jgi:hypothetical protein
MHNAKLGHFVAGALVALISSAATHSLDARAAAPKKDVKKSTSHVLLSPEDYTEIQQLISFYPRDVDPGSVRDASWMFAKDAKAVISGPKPMTTPEDFKTFYSGVKNGQAKGGGVRHFNGSYVIVGLPDGTARGSSYMMQIETRAKGGHPEVTLFGKYEDKFVKTAEGWRIKERVWRADSFRGSNQEVTPSPVPNDPNTYSTGIEKLLAAAQNTPAERPAQGAQPTASGR